MEAPNTPRLTVKLIDRKCVGHGAKCVINARSTVVATVELTPTMQDNTEVAGITGYIFGLHNASREEQQQQAWDMQPTMQPSTMEDLLPVMAALRELGPVTSPPLPCS